MIDSPQAWSAGSSSNFVGQYMEIDLGSDLSIGGIAIQGRVGSQRVTGYTVQYKKSGENTYASVDNDKIFNDFVHYNGYGAWAEVPFAQSVVGRHFRIIVQTWEHYASMRAGVLLAEEASTLVDLTNTPDCSSDITECPNHLDELCVSCFTGYYLSGGDCFLNDCTCQDGTEAIGPFEHTGLLCPVDGQARCRLCDTGFYLTEDYRMVLKNTDSEYDDL